MKPHPTRSAVYSMRMMVIITVVIAIAVPVILKASPPSWWTTRGVTDATKQANDYAAVNQGQVKMIATQAAAELDANLPGGAGDAVHKIIEAWGTPTAITNDYTIVNLGQLKHLAAPFYDQLVQAGYTTAYPWNGSLAQANDFAAANIGQVKNLFSFDLKYDSDGNGIPDWWEKHWFGHIGIHANDPADRGDGLTNLQAYQQGLNPNDYYNGQAPTINYVSGRDQSGAPNEFVAAPLVVSVTDTNQNPIVNAPVKFVVSQGGGHVQKSSIGTSITTVTVLTDYNGQAKAFFQLSGAASDPNQVTVSPGSGSYPSSQVFNATADAAAGSNISPFAPTNVVATLNADGSMDVTWTNNADSSDQSLISIQDFDANGTYHTIFTAPAGSTSCRIPAQ